MWFWKYGPTLGIFFFCLEVYSISLMSGHLCVPLVYFALWSLGWGRPSDTWRRHAPAWVRMRARVCLCVCVRTKPCPWLKRKQNLHCDYTVNGEGSRQPIDLSHCTASWDAAKPSVCLSTRITRSLYNEESSEKWRWRLLYRGLDSVSLILCHILPADWGWELKI